MYDYIEHMTDGRFLAYGTDDDLEAKLAKAREFGLLLHNEYEEADVDGLGAQIVRDDWYCASPEWVEGYRNSGGLWAYGD